MIFFLPWVILIVAAIVAVPVAAKMSPRAVSYDVGNDATEAEEYEDVQEAAIAGDDFGAEPAAAEPLGDDAFDDLG